MQNKGLIRGFAIVFALACLFQLSFSFVTYRVEKAAKAYADGDIEKENAYLDSMANQRVFNLGLRNYTFSEVKEREINLGLDLKGGMNVILEVSVKDIIKELSNDKEEPLLIAAIEAADKNVGGSNELYVNVFFRELDRIIANEDEKINYASSRLFGTKMMNDRLGFNAQDARIKEELRGEVEAAVSNVYTVLRARIDQFGVVQPNIQKLENTGRILVELPGVKDPERVKRLLQSTAQLEFWNLYEGVELIEFLGQANERLRTLVERPEGEERDADISEVLGDMDIEPMSDEEIDQLDIEDADNVDEATESENELDALLDEQAEEEDFESLLSDEGDTTEIDEEEMFNPLFDVFAPNYDFQENRPGRGPIVGYTRVQDTAKVNEYLRMSQVRALLPPSMRYVRFAWSAKPEGPDQLVYLLALKGNRDMTPALDGDVVVDARQDFDERNRPIVNMRMNAVGSQKWQKITREASSQEPKRSVAVVLDNLVYSFPTVQSEISGGSTQISGNFNILEAQDLANILKAGKLPAPARIVQADVVGPSLGQAAIRAGLYSFVLALIIVLVYMIFYYNVAGVASNVALIVNMFFIFGVLASLGAVLTLPGIAGIILTIGIAVDANVLIYERVREEIRAGKGLKLAVEHGYKQAMSSILDANITTLLTGIILYVFGTGPIRGFATTLIIGIFTSLFSAIFITRLILESRLAKKQSVKFGSKLTMNAFSNIKIDFVGKRNKSYLISGIIIVIGIVSLFVRGLDYGVDFVGGRSFQVRFEEPVNTVDIQSELANVFVDESGTPQPPIVKTIGDANQVIITTKYRIDESGIEVEDAIRQKLFEGLQPFVAEGTEYGSFMNPNNADYGVVAERQVGPTIAADIKQAAIWAILFSIVVIFLYILLRFRGWQFSLGAVSAATHDVLVVLALFSIFYGILPFSLEIDQSFIAAILTVIGYSLNDTVVVFDRIREYFATHSKRKPIKEVVNEAVNSTISRTINTSATTFFVLLVIFIFGGDVIRGFMFALMVGVVVGTYSSVFIATPIMVDTYTEKARLREIERKNKPIAEGANTP
ncbi:MAG: protein translocase subunit SecDF [Cryomorphaceae bacterium]|nr:protein translocase subunit SecDF [Cryomorphaceae bacterium]